MSASNDTTNPSTVSLQTTETITSTSPLTGARKPQKDFSEAFGALQSRYGVGGHSPMPFNKKPAVAATSSTTTPSTSSYSSETSQQTLPGPGDATPAGSKSTPNKQGTGEQAKPKKKLLQRLLKRKEQ